MYVFVCFVCMYFCTAEEGIRPHGTTVTDGCEPPRVLGIEPLVEQPLLLILEPALLPQPHQLRQPGSCLHSLPLCPFASKFLLEPLHTKVCEVGENGEGGKNKECEKRK